jgi:hypothetical protein
MAGSARFEALFAVSVLAAIGCAGPRVEATAAVVSPAVQTAADAPASASGEDLAAIIPEGMAMFVEIEDAPGLLSKLELARALGNDPIDALANLAAREGRADRAEIVNVLRSLDGLAFAMRKEKSSAVLIARFRDAAPLEALLHKIGEPSEAPLGGKRYPFGKDDNLVWYPQSRLMLVGASAPLADIAEVMAGRAPSLAKSRPFASVRKSFAPPPALRGVLDMWAILDPAKEKDRRALDGLLMGGEPLLLELATDPPRLAMSMTFSGDLVLPTSIHAPAAPLTIASHLPEETVAYLAYSSKLGVDSHALSELIEARIEAAGQSTTAMKIALGASLGTSLTELLALIGDQGAIGAMFVGDPALLRGKPSFEHGMALVWVQQLRDADAGKRLNAILDRVAKLGAKKGVIRERDGLRVPIKYQGRDLVLRVAGDRLLVAAGWPQDLARAEAAFLHGKGAIGAALPATPGAHAIYDLRLAQYMSLLPPGTVPDALVKQVAAHGSTVTLRWQPAGEGWKVRAEMGLGAAGALSALGVYGVRRYIASSKTSEAKSFVGAFARAAVTAYEREIGPGPKPSHALCASAPAVPAAIPSGVKYQPSTSAGTDFDTGDQKSGWRCLKFSAGMPIHYRYSYRAGGGYLGPQRGGPDAGANGFEVAAEGDLDGDGNTSLFTITGTVDPKTSTVRIGKLFVVDEYE